MSDSNMDFARAALAQRRPFFLSLAPTTSDSYPRVPVNRPSAPRASISESVALTERSRRSSNGFRVLKLGPVYWGEHADDHQEDFYAVDDAASTTSTEPASSFLSLAPTISASYPRMPVSRPLVEATESAQPEPSSRRSSSSSSTTGFRVLKLGPVYWGEHADEHKADFHDVVIPGSP